MKKKSLKIFWFFVLKKLNFFLKIFNFFFLANSKKKNDFYRKSKKCLSILAKNGKFLPVSTIFWRTNWLCRGWWVVISAEYKLVTIRSAIYTNTPPPLAHQAIFSWHQIYLGCEIRVQTFECQLRPNRKCRRTPRQHSWGLGSAVSPLMGLQGQSPCKLSNFQRLFSDFFYNFSYLERLKSAYHSLPSISVKKW